MRTHRIALVVLASCLGILTGPQVALSQAEAKPLECLVRSRLLPPNSPRFFRSRSFFALSQQDSRLSQIAIQYASIGNSQQALTIAESIEAALPKAETLIAIAKFSAQQGEPQLASATISQARELFKNIEENVTVYLLPDLAEAYLQLSESYREQGEMKRATEAVSLGSQTIENLDNSLSRDRLLSRLAVQLAGIGKVGEAVEIAQGFTGYERIYRLTEIALKLVSIGELEQALRVTQSLDDRGYALVRIAIELAAIGEFEQAMTIVQSLDSGYNRSDALGGIAQQYVNAGKVNFALEMLQGIEDDCTRLRSVNDLFFRLLEAQKHDLALEVAANLERDKERSNALKEVASRLAEIGELNRAILLLEQITYPEYRADALVAVSEHLIAAGRSEQAAEFLSEAMEIVNSLPESSYTPPEEPTIYYWSENPNK